MKSKKMRNRALLLLGLTTAVMLMFNTGAAFARAGGGESYSSDSSSDSSSDFSSDSPSSSSSGSSSSAPSSPGTSCVGTLIFIAIIVFIVMLKRKKQAGAGGIAVQTSAGQPQAVPVAGVNLGEQLADLKFRDPNFSEQQFEDLASAAFFKIQDAWARRDMSFARAFVSPSLLIRFSTQLDAMKRDRKINKMEKLAVGSVEIVEAAHDGGNDYVTARINASAADYTVDEKTGKLVSGSTNPAPFTEFWSFLRSDQALTPDGAPELESKHCPNCGAPTKVNAVGKCDYCGSDVTSGRYSWVLAEISQASVWRPRSSGHPARPENVSPLAGGRYVLGIVQCPNCGANVQDIAGVTNEQCWRCGATVKTER